MWFNEYIWYRNITCNWVECSMPTSDRRQECIGYIQGVLHVKNSPRKNSNTHNMSPEINLTNDIMDDSRNSV